MFLVARHDDIDGVRESLLRGLRHALGPSEGDEAFERHILLAVRIHKAAGLNQTVIGEGKGWVQYFEEHFPQGRNSPVDAQCLWEDWRVGLVKNESPRLRVSITHGQPWLHWYRETPASICVNLESMWDDFEASVESFVALLGQDDVRCAEAVTRWRARSWTIRQLTSGPTAHLPVLSYSTSATFSASAAGPLPPYGSTE